MTTYMLKIVERTTIYLDAATRRLLKVAAKSQHVSEAVIIREALRAHLRCRRFANPRAVGRSTDGGVARDLDTALEELGFGRPAR
jgi:hypothetical protein